MSKRLNKAEKLQYIENVRKRWFSIYDGTELDYKNHIFEMVLKWTEVKQ